MLKNIIFFVTFQILHKTKSSKKIKLYCKCELNVALKTFPTHKHVLYSSGFWFMEGCSAEQIYFAKGSLILLSVRFAARPMKLRSTLLLTALLPSRSGINWESSLRQWQPMEASSTFPATTSLIITTPPSSLYATGIFGKGGMR